MTYQTWIVYKADNMSAQGWEYRKLMPSNAGTDILWENWDYSGRVPQVGDRTKEYENLAEPGNGITHSREGDWVVTQIEHFSSSETGNRIIVCYCEYQPIRIEWKVLNRVDDGIF